MLSFIKFCFYAVIPLCSLSSLIMFYHSQYKVSALILMVGGPIATSYVVALRDEMQEKELRYYLIFLLCNGLIDLVIYLFFPDILKI